MISKFENKFYNRDDIEVRADKFVSTYSKLAKTEVGQEQKSTQQKAPPPPPPASKPVAPPPPPPTASKPAPPPPSSSSVSTDFSNDFASVFSGKTLQTASTQTTIASDANFLDEYYKDVIMPVLNNIKEELSKYGKEVTYTMNKTLNISSLSVNYQGRNEYDYIIQIKKGATASSSILTLKESGQRGGYDIRETLTNMKLNQVSKADFIKDFLSGYRKFAVSKGWMKL